MREELASALTADKRVPTVYIVFLLRVSWTSHVWDCSGKGHQRSVVCQSFANIRSNPIELLWGMPWLLGVDSLYRGHCHPLPVTGHYVADILSLMFLQIRDPRRLSEQHVP